jgi:phage terminase Nu1 subunit (DNA packaging protein)
MATAVQAAQHIHLSPSRFRDYVAQGVIKRKPSGSYVLDEVREQYCLHAQKVMAGRLDEGGKSLSTQRARLATAQADAQIMRTGIMAGEYVRLSVFKRIIEQGFMAMRSIALNVPDKISDAIAEISGVERGVIDALIRDEIYEMLTLLSTPDVISRAMDPRPDRRQRRAADIEEGIPA